MVICSFMWAADHVDVTNNSYFADPWLFNCRNDAEQRAIWKAERRAIRYAMSKGVVVVASEGNESTDLSHPRVDVISPDFPPGSEQEREITNACAVVPVEVPGVIGVTATSNRSVKSFYSSYGVTLLTPCNQVGLTLLRCQPECAKRPRPLNLSIVPPLYTRGFRPGREVLLSSGHLDGWPACCRCGCVNHESRRQQSRRSRSQDRQYGHSARMPGSVPSGHRLPAK
jgi:subtilisin family serine protease